MVAVNLARLCDIGVISLHVKSVRDGGERGLSALRYSDLKSLPCFLMFPQGL